MVTVTLSTVIYSPVWWSFERHLQRFFFKRFLLLKQIFACRKRTTQPRAFVCANQKCCVKKDCYSIDAKFDGCCVPDWDNCWRKRWENSWRTYSQMDRCPCVIRDAPVYSLKLGQCQSSNYGRKRPVCSRFIRIIHGPSWAVIKFAGARGFWFAGQVVRVLQTNNLQCDEWQFLLEGTCLPN